MLQEHDELLPSGALEQTGSASQQASCLHRPNLPVERQPRQRKGHRSNSGISLTAPAAARHDAEVVIQQMRAIAARKKDARRVTRVRHRDDFVFVHINKTGGSSIEKALKLPSAPNHHTALQWRSEIGDAEWDRRFTFTFVRNPWEKVLSQYAYRLQREDKALMASGIDFNSWVRLTFEDHDPTYYNQPKMFMPQAAWICDENGEQLVDFIGRFERLEEDFATVCRRIGRSGSLPHAKASRHGHYRDAYQRGAREIVSHWFARDIEWFGYTF
jgi:chondroitin 4-sulfotransferase 11